MARKKGDVKKYIPDDKTRSIVETMKACGVIDAEIASVLGISVDTLDKHYRAELDTGAPKANTRIAQRLYKKALDGDTASMIFWLKTRARWVDTTKIEHTGADGGAIQHEHTLDVTDAAERLTAQIKMLSDRRGAIDIDSR